MQTDFVQRVKLRLKGMSAYGGAPVVLQKETEALAIEFGGAFNAQAGDIAELHDKLDRYKGAVLAEFIELCTHVTTLEAKIGQMRRELFALKTQGCDE